MVRIHATGALLMIAAIVTPLSIQAAEVDVSAQASCTYGGFGNWNIKSSAWAMAKADQIGTELGVEAIAHNNAEAHQSISPVAWVLHANAQDFDVVGDGGEAHAEATATAAGPFERVPPGFEQETDPCTPDASAFSSFARAPSSISCDHEIDYEYGGIFEAFFSEGGDANGNQIFISFHTLLPSLPGPAVTTVGTYAFADGLAFSDDEPLTSAVLPADAFSVGRGSVQISELLCSSTIAWA